MIINGHIHFVGDHVDTDAIIPARRCSVHQGDLLAPYLLEDYRPELRQAIKQGDLLFAGDNFGHGSSREHAPLAIKASGIACVVARSFARIFYRNAINIALPVIICEEAVAAAREGGEAVVNLLEGTILLEEKENYSFAPLPPFMQELMEQGGLVQYVAARLDQGQY